MYRLSLSRFLYHQAIESVSTPNGWDVPISTPVGESCNHFISNKGEWNNCFSKFSNRVLPPIFISTILQSEKTWRTIFHDVKLRLLAHSRSFLAFKKLEMQ